MERKKGVINWFRRVIYWLCALFNNHNNPNSNGYIVNSN